MREVTLDELKQVAADSREAVWSAAESVGREPKVYLHWTAGHYGQQYDSYHINIDEDGEIYLTTDDLSEKLSHTWLRNTGAVGITLDCCAHANTEDLGDEPPTAKQIEVMAQCVAAVCEGLWLTIDKAHVMTHGEAADNEDGLEPHEPYGPRTDCDRWDLEYLGTEESPEFLPWSTNGRRGGDVIRGKANWYANEWKKGE